MVNCWQIKTIKIIQIMQNHWCCQLIGWWIHWIQPVLPDSHDEVIFLRFLNVHQKQCRRSFSQIPWVSLQVIRRFLL